MLPGAGGTQRLARTVGPARALELILEAQLLTPDEALAAGLVHRVIPHDRLVPEAVETADRLARRAPISVAAAKRAAWEGASGPLDDGLALERKWFMAAVSTSRPRSRVASPTTTRSRQRRWRRGRSPSRCSRGATAPRWRWSRTGR